MATAIKNGFVQLMRYPPIKEGVKKGASTAAFVFGFVEVYDILRVREVSNELPKKSLTWSQTAAKVALICAKISLLLSAATSYPGAFLISTLTGALFSPSQLESAFGPNTIFAINPWHPRHVVSIAAAILALPAAAHAIYRGIQWLSQDSTTLKSAPQPTDTTIRLMALFNTIFSRPTLHIMNQLL